MNKLKNIFKFILLMSLFSFSVFTGCKHDAAVESPEIEDDSSIKSSQSENLEKFWYKTSSIYQIWVKSYADSDGDGTGDFNGIKNKLDYIKNDLGCDTIWLSPIFECANKSSTMHGYDTTDYYSVNSKFGTMQDLADLVTACHNKSIKIIFDFVPNHTSSSHPWFTKSASGDSEYKDYYLWNSSKLSCNTGMDLSGWHYNSTRNAYYYGAFGSDMPDLNYANEKVRDEIKNIAKYWLDFGFDGMRVDAVRYLVERENNTSSFVYTDSAASHKYFAELRSLIDSYSSYKFMMCEAWIEGDRTSIEKYLGSSSAPEFNMILDFDEGRPCLESVQYQYSKFNSTSNFKANPSTPSGAGFASFLCNHDLYTNRIGTELEENQKKMALATALSLVRVNVPIIYYGQEIGMKNADGVYGDTALRGSFDWSSVSTQKTDTGSLLNLNKALLNLRKKYSSLFASGSMQILQNDTVFAYTITNSDTTLLCVYNLTQNGKETVIISAGVGSTLFSTLIGDDDESSVSVNESKVTITNLSPFAYRVYLIGASNAENLFDNESYSSYISPYQNIYLRGSMNNWGATPMTNESGTDKWTCSATLKENTTYEFKFCSTSSDWTGTEWAANSSSNTCTKGESYEVCTASSGENSNINFTASDAGTYTFTLDAYNKQLIISK